MSARQSRVGTAHSAQSFLRTFVTRYPGKSLRTATAKAIAQIRAGGPVHARRRPALVDLGRAQPAGRARGTAAGEAVDAVHERRWGTMVALSATEIVSVALADAVTKIRRVPVDECRRFGVLFG